MSEDEMMKKTLKTAKIIAMIGVSSVKKEISNIILPQLAPGLA